MRVHDAAQLAFSARVLHGSTGSSHATLKCWCRRLLLDKLDGAVEKYSAARQWHFFEICLGMAIAVVGWYICNLWYQGALSR